MNFLVTAATAFEMQAYLDAGGSTIDGLQLVTGVGPVETTLSLACFLSAHSGHIDGVLNFGVAGAYLENGSDQQAAMLDICLARQEVLGDFGICLAAGFERLRSPDLRIADSFILDLSLLQSAGQGLADSGIDYKRGTFVTVNCVSGTEKRGRLLGGEFQGLCENMEGAAVARVCQQFALPCCEVRSISNMVEDRNTEAWQLKPACTRAGKAAVAIMKFWQVEGCGAKKSGSTDE